jgi:hypothetical protein
VRYLLIAALAAAGIALIAQEKDHTLGYDNTPYLPGGKWRVHDVSRPRPLMVTPGIDRGGATAPPSDAIVLFDGKDFSHWTTRTRGQETPPKWKLENGYMEVVPHAGSIQTTDKLGDIQLHLEWATPAKVENKSQDRGNSGVLLMTRYEVQVLDSWDNPTYADGQAAALYGQTPPMVNASRPPGEWQNYDIFFEAPRFADGKLTKPGYVTVVHNGVLVQLHRELIGDTPHAKVGTYKPHGDEEPLELQNHNTAVRYRNIWVRKLQLPEPWPAH